MPLYPWLCAKCGKEKLEVRSFAEYDIPPEEKESTTCDSHNWERRVGGGQTVLHPPGYGSKGNW